MDSVHTQARRERAHIDRRPAPPARRTVQIRGQVAPPRRRSPAAAQIATRPDRVAMWAVMLGLFLVFMAVVTAAS